MDFTIPPVTGGFPGENESHEHTRKTGSIVEFG